MFYKLLSRIQEYIDNHAATKGRPRLFQVTVLLIVIIILTFIIARLKNWGALDI